MSRIRDQGAFDRLIGAAARAAARGDRVGEAAAYARAGKAARLSGESEARRIAVGQRLALALHHLGSEVVAEKHLTALIVRARADRDGTVTQSMLGQCLDTRGLIRRDRGDLKGAAHDHREALSLLDGDQPAAARAEVNLAVVHKDSHRLTEARATARSALRRARRAGDRAVLGHALVTLGLVHELRHDVALAERYARLAAAVLEGDGDLIGAAVAAHNVGRMVADHRDPVAGAQWLRRALELNQRAGSLPGQAADVGAMAALAHGLGSSKAARDLHEQALTLLMRGGDPRGAIATLTDLAVLDATEGDTTAAHDHLVTAMRLARETGLTRDLFDLHLRLGDLAASLVNAAPPGMSEGTERAKREYLAAAELLAALRSGLLEEREALDWFRVDGGDPYIRLAGLEAKRHRPRTALRHAEAGRSQEMVRRLAERTTTKPIGTPADLVELEAAARARMRAGLAVLAGPLGDSEAAGAAGTAYRSAQSEWLNALTAIRPYDPRYVELRWGVSQDTPEMAGGLAEEERMSAARVQLVEYYLTTDAVLLFRVTAESEEPDLIALDIDPAKLTDKVLALTGALDDAAAGDGEALRRAAEALADPMLVALVQPIFGWSEPGDRLHLVPHGPLHRVPLHAVPYRGTCLAERNPVGYSPSASVLRYCQANRRLPRTNVLAVIDPVGTRPLTFGRAQAAAAATDLAHSVRAGADADRDRLIRDLSGPLARPPSVLHVGAHGVFDLEDPMRSGVELTGGRLTATDILGLNLSGSLVVLAACRSGVSEARPGDELLGLIRALMYAGAPAVLVSLWKVDELSTAMLLEHFYQKLGAGESAGDALHRAQLWLRERTAGDVVAFAARIRADGPVTARQALAEAKIRMLAGDHVGAGEAAREAATVASADEERREARALTAKATLLAGVMGDRSDRLLYEHPYFWAPFVLVGDWQ